LVDKLLVTQDAGRTRKVEIAPGITVGGGKPVVIAGPCSVESRDQILDTARAIRAAGAHMLRGGAFKPRTSPYSFQGLGEEGLKLLAEARDVTGLPVVTEVMGDADIPLVSAYADVLQVGSRSMQNFRLLQALGKCSQPVLLKRGLAATLEEWLHAAEYIVSGGNDRVILCERGIRTFEVYTRNTLDLGSALAAKQLSHLPVIADPSHGSGRRDLVPGLALAAMAAGLDGVIVEVHADPDRALSDADQTISTGEFVQLMNQLGLAPVAGDQPGRRQQAGIMDRHLLPLLVRRTEVAESAGDAALAAALRGLLGALGGPGTPR
jgi:3-deoxy-7-phosphoheptulonate synthase